MAGRGGGNEERERSDREKKGEPGARTRGREAARLEPRAAARPGGGRREKDMRCLNCRDRGGRYLGRLRV